METPNTRRKGLAQPGASETTAPPVAEPRNTIRPLTMFIEATSLGRHAGWEESRRKLNEESSWPANTKPAQAWPRQIVSGWRSSVGGRSQKKGRVPRSDEASTRHFRDPKRSAERPQTGRNRNLKRTVMALIRVKER